MKLAQGFDMVLPVFSVDTPFMCLSTSPKGKLDKSSRSLLVKCPVFKGIEI